MLFTALRGRLAHSIRVLAAILLCNGGGNKSHTQSKKATTVSHPSGRFLSSLRFSAFNWETFGLGGAQVSTVFGLVLAACLPGTVLDHLVGEETMADYLLYTLNRHGLFG